MSVIWRLFEGLLEGDNCRLFEGYLRVYSKAIRRLNFRLFAGYLPVIWGYLTVIWKARYVWDFADKFEAQHWITPNPNPNPNPNPKPNSTPNPNWYDAPLDNAMGNSKHLAGLGLEVGVTMRIEGGKGWVLAIGVKMRG